jgi:hypothetical protein
MLQRWLLSLPCAHAAAATTTACSLAHIAPCLSASPSIQIAGAAASCSTSFSSWAAQQASRGAEHGPSHHGASLGRRQPDDEAPSQILEWMLPLALRFQKHYPPTVRVEAGAGWGAQDEAGLILHGLWHGDSTSSSLPLPRRRQVYRAILSAASPPSTQNQGRPVQIVDYGCGCGVSSVELALR